MTRSGQDERGCRRPALHSGDGEHHNNLPPLHTCWGVQAPLLSLPSGASSLLGVAQAAGASKSSRAAACRSALAPIGLLAALPRR